MASLNCLKNALYFSGPFCSAKRNGFTRSTQRQWELKRESLIEGGSAASGFLRAVSKLNAAYAVEHKPEDLAYETQLANHQTEAMTAVNTASNDFQRAMLMVSVVSSIETQKAFVAVERILKTAGIRIVDGDTTAYAKLTSLIKTSATAITNAIRKELGIELVGTETTFLSGESSEAPIPGSPAPE